MGIILYIIFWVFMELLFLSLFVVDILNIDLGTFLQAVAIIVALIHLIVSQNKIILLLENIYFYINKISIGNIENVEVRVNGNPTFLTYAEDNKKFLNKKERKIIK